MCNLVERFFFVCRLAKEPKLIHWQAGPHTDKIQNVGRGRPRLLRIVVSTFLLAWYVLCKNLNKKAMAVVWRASIGAAWCMSFVWANGAFVAHRAS